MGLVGIEERGDPHPAFAAVRSAAWPALPDMEGELRALLAQIPPGRITTYGTLASALGDRLASRWVGHFLLHHPHDDACPCHRVVRVDGSLGGYVDGDSTEKARRLRAEGVMVANNAVDRQRLGFDDFRGTRPLLALRQAQQDAARRLCLDPPPAMPGTVAGLDVSYTSSGEGVAAYVLVDFPGGAPLWHATARQPVRFPYIQSFLSFRELPLLLSVLANAEASNRLADVLLIDGSGLAHQRHIGLASHLGVVVGRPTIGVTKSLLCGSVDLSRLRHGESRLLMDQGVVIGAALKSRPPSEQILYVSPGNLVDVAYTVSVVRPLLRGRRLPEPLYWADHLSRQAARGREAPSWPVRTSRSPRRQSAAK
jgi:deoxyribonuclease V